MCRYCGTRSGLTVDHVVPLSKGGKWVWENLVTACSKCNGKKGSKSLKQLGWTLKQRPKARCAAPQHSLRIPLWCMLVMAHRSLSVVGTHVLTSLKAGVLTNAGRCRSPHPTRWASF